MRSLLPRSRCAPVRSAYPQFDEITRLADESKAILDKEAAETQESLLVLYRNAFPNTPLPELIGEEWKDLGFQVSVLYGVKQ